MPFTKNATTEPLVQIKNNFTEMFLIMPSSKITQTVLLNKMAIRAKDKI